MDKSSKAFIISLILILNTIIVFPIITTEGQAIYAVYYALPSEIDRFSQFAPQSYATDQLLSAVSAGLYSLSVDDDEYYEPDLAQDFPTVSENGTVYSVSLKPSLKFSDGSPVNAKDVVFTYRSLLSPAINKRNYNFYHNYFSSNDSISQIDDLSIRFEIKNYTGGIMQLLSAYIQPEAHFQVRLDNNEFDWNSDDFSDTISAGPFVLNDLNQNNSYVVVNRNQQYWNGDNVASDHIHFIHIADKNVALEMARGNKAYLLDYHYNFSKDEIDDLTGIIQKNIILAAHQELGINHLHPYIGSGELLPAENKTDGAKNVRKAISHLIERDQIVEYTLEGMAEAAATIVPNPSYGFTDELDYRNYSLGVARNYLRSAGLDFSDLGYKDADGKYSNSFFDITIIVPTGNLISTDWIDLMIQELPKVGIGVNIVDMGHNEIYERTIGAITPPSVYSNGGFDIIINEYFWSKDFNPYGIFESFNIVPHGQNIYNFNNSYYDMISSELSLAIDSDNQTRLMRDLQDFVYDWEIVIPIIYPKANWVFSYDLWGYDLNLLSQCKFNWTPIGQYDSLGPHRNNNIDLYIFVGLFLIAFVYFYRYKKN